jgi:hypothetical protein
MKSVREAKSFRLVSVGVGHLSRPLRTHKFGRMDFLDSRMDPLLQAELMGLADGFVHA